MWQPDDPNHCEHCSEPVCVCELCPCGEGFIKPGRDECCEFCKPQPKPATVPNAA